MGASTTETSLQHSGNVKLKTMIAAMAKQSIKK